MFSKPPRGLDGLRRQLSPRIVISYVNRPTSNIRIALMMITAWQATRYISPVALHCIRGHDRVADDARPARPDCGDWAAAREPICTCHGSPSLFSRPRRAGPDESRQHHPNSGRPWLWPRFPLRHMPIAVQPDRTPDVGWSCVRDALWKRG